MATKEEARKAVFDVAYVFGHQLDRDAIDAMADVILAGKWTTAELELAAAYIPTDYELLLEQEDQVNHRLVQKARSHAIRHQ